MEIKRVIMTPGWARELLGINVRNRHANKRVVSNLAQAILRGEWVEDANPVKVSVDGTLLDGQHRLLAIVEADYPVPLFLVTGVPEEARLSVDTGAKRSFAHYLTIRGVSNGGEVGAVTRLLYMMREAKAKGVTPYSGNKFASPTYPQLWALYAGETDAIHESVSAGRRISRSVNLSRALAGIEFFLLAEISPEDAEDFFAKLTLERTPEESSILSLARQLAKRDDASNGEQIYKAAIINKAWNAYLKGEDVDNLYWRRGGKAREPFPWPIGRA